MKKNIFLSFFILVLASLAYAGTQNRIELMDGSTIEGEVVSFSNGRYTVKSPNSGTLQVEASKIRTIRNADQTDGSLEKGSVPLSALDIQSEIRKYRPEIANNPELMKVVSGLISNPDVQSMLKDPDLVNAARSRDIKTLMANQKFISMINSPVVKEIRQKIKKEQ